MSHLLKTFFDAPLLVLWGDKTSDDSKNPRLTFGFRDGRPRITVNTGVQGREGMIVFAADVANMTAMMLYLHDVALGPADQQIINDSLSPVYMDNKPTAEKKVKGSLIVGKTKDGVVYITVIAEGFPKLVFPFKPSQYHIFRDASRAVIPAADLSVKMAIGYSEQVRNLITTAIYSHACEEYDSGARKLSSTENGGQEGGGGSKSNKDDGTRFEDLGDLVL